MKGFSKKFLVTVCAIVLFVGIGTAYALSTWTQSITWNWVNPPPSFTVSNPTTVAYGDITQPTTKTETYTITNSGTVPINVTATATATGATATWDKTSAGPIQPAATATFTLTLQITGAGSCSVTFALA